MSEQKPSIVLRYAVQFQVTGDLRFLSHHDTLRMFQRAAVRGSLPLQYSAGFNPNPKLSLPLPRPVGLGGLEEWLLVQLREPLDPADVRRRLEASVSRGISIRGCWRCRTSESWQTLETLIELPLEGVSIATLDARIEQLRDAASAVIRRDMGPKKPPRSLDAKPFIVAVERHGDRLQMRLRYQSGSTVRPSEVLELVGLPAQPNASLATRVSITWAPRDILDGYPSDTHSRLPEESRSS